MEKNITSYHIPQGLGRRELRNVLYGFFSGEYRVLIRGPIEIAPFWEQ